MDDGKGETTTPAGATIGYCIGAEGIGYYYDIDVPELRNWGPFPGRDIAERWHEAPDSISDADIAAIRTVRGYR